MTRTAIITAIAIYAGTDAMLPLCRLSKSGAVRLWRPNCITHQSVGVVTALIDWLAFEVSCIREGLHMICGRACSDHLMSRLNHLLHPLVDLTPRDILVLRVFVVGRECNSCLRHQSHEVLSRDLPYNVFIVEGGKQFVVSSNRRDIIAKTTDDI